VRLSSGYQYFYYHLIIASQEVKMLRRKPTAIHLTAEDIASYEDRQAQAQAEAEAAAQSQKAQNNIDPNDELRPKPNERFRHKTREERLGIAGVAR
jgi:hypothetical protein